MSTVTRARKTTPQSNPQQPAPAPRPPHCFAPTHALSVRQPWASLIVLGLKGIENRSWSTAFRGRIAIHASQKPADPQDLAGFLSAPPLMADPQEIASFGRHVQQEFDPQDRENQISSCIVGTVEITNVVTTGLEDPGTLPQDSPGFDTPPWCWAAEVSHHWCLANPVAFERPVPCGGRLNLWSMPSAVAREVARQDAIAWVCRHDDPALVNPLELREVYRILTGALPTAGTIQTWYETVCQIVEPG